MVIFFSCVSFFFLSSVYVVCMCACMCVNAHVYMSMWRPENDIRCPPWSCSTFCFFTKIWSLTEPRACLASVASQLVPGIPALPPECWDYRCTATPASHLHGFRGFELMSSCLYGECWAERGLKHVYRQTLPGMTYSLLVPAVLATTLRLEVFLCVIHTQERGIICLFLLLPTLPPFFCLFQRKDQGIKWLNKVHKVSK